MAIAYLSGIALAGLAIFLGNNGSFPIFGIFNKLQLYTCNIVLLAFYVLRKKTKLTSLIAACLLVFIIATPIAILFICIARYGVNCVSWDQWPTVLLIAKYKAGILTLSDIAAPYDCHREFFPRIIMLVLALLTGYNTIAELYMNALFLIATLFVVLFALRKQILLSRNLLFIVPLIYLILSPQQMRSMMHGQGMNWFLVNAAGTASLYSLYASAYCRNTKKTVFLFFTAIAFGTIASFSLGTGTCVWVAGLLQLMITRPSFFRGLWLMPGLWMLAAVLNAVCYFNTTNNIILEEIVAQTVSGFSVIAKNPSERAFSLPVFLGLSLGGKNHQPLIWGIMLLSLSVIGITLLHVYRRLKENGLWISMLVFAACAIFLIFIGRAYKEQFPPRYAVNAILFVVALYVIFLNLFLELRGNLAVRILYAAITCLIIISIPVSFVDGRNYARAGQKHLAEAASILATYEHQPDAALARIGPRASFIKEYAPVLKRLRYNLFK